MTWLVRSPFSRAVDRSLMLITVRGRRSGTPYTLPVQYAEAGGAIWVLPGHADTKTWWRNLLAGSEVELHLRGQEVHATAQAFSGDTSPSVVEEGLATYFGRFPAVGRRSGVSDKAGEIDQARLTEMAKDTIIVRVTRSRRASSADA